MEDEEESRVAALLPVEGERRGRAREAADRRGEQQRDDAVARRRGLGRGVLRAVRKQREEEAQKLRGARRRLGEAAATTLEQDEHAAQEDKQVAGHGGERGRAAVTAAEGDGAVTPLLGGDFEFWGIPCGMDFGS